MTPRTEPFVDMAHRVSSQPPDSAWQDAQAVALAVVVLLVIFVLSSWVGVAG